MTYYNTSTNSATTATDTIAFIETGLSAHAGWSLIETNTTIVGSSTVRVWKCLGSQNAGASDFYLILTRSTVDNAFFSIQLSEGYNLSTHKMIRPAPISSTPLAVTASDWSIGAGTEYVLTDGTVFRANISMSQSTATDHFLVVSKSFVAYSNNQSGTARNGFYVGNFDPTYSTSYNPVMIVTVGSTTGTIQNGNSLSSYGSSSVTRYPNYAFTLVDLTFGQQYVSDAYIMPATFPGGYLTTLSIAEKFTNKMEGSSVLINGFSAIALSQSLSNSGGGLRGRIPSSVMLLVSESIAPRNGDFFDVGGTEYFRVGSSAAAPYSALMSNPNRCFYISKLATY